MTEEIWKGVVDFPDYAVSNHGNVRSSNGLLTISSCESKKGSGGWGPFMGVSLAGSRKRVHRLVAQAFVELPFESEDPELIELLYSVLWVLHKDGNWRNNKATNLRWGTPKQNAEDTKRHRELRERGLDLTLEKVPSYHHELFEDL